MNKYFLPYDIYERHKKVGSQINHNDTVLDVGGELDQLSRFCPASKIIVANLKQSQEKSDIIIKKGKLPFGPDSFAVVCAIDVLEHIPKRQRSMFVKNLEKVSAKKVILSFPIGTNPHINYEEKLARWLKQKGHDISYLEEHIVMGLPTPGEITQLFKGKNITVSYSGNLMVSKLLFKIFLFDPKVKTIRKIVYFTKLFFNLMTNPILYFFLSDENLSNQVVRAYVTINKNK